MTNVFENLKNCVRDYFPKSKVEMDKEYLNPFKCITKRSKDLDESSSLLDSNRIKHLGYEREDPKLNETVFNGSQLVIIYGICSILMITLLLGEVFLRDLPAEIFSAIGTTNKIRYVSFFDLIKINEFAFHCLNTSCALSGIVLVYLIYINLLGKLKDSNMFISLAVSYGFLSHIISFIYGCIPYIDGLEGIKATFKSEMRFTLREFVFLIQIFFTVLFGVFTLLLSYNLEAKPSHCIDTYSNCAGFNFNNTHPKWLTYKILSLCYLIFFTLSYVVIILHSNNVILQNFDYPILKVNYPYLICMLPYATFILNMIFYLTFYGEMNSVNFCISIIDTQAYQSHILDKYGKNSL